jgi:hypothetical protein
MTLLLTLIAYWGINAVLLMVAQPLASKALHLSTLLFRFLTHPFLFLSKIKLLRQLQRLDVRIYLIDL